MLMLRILVYKYSFHLKHFTNILVVVDVLSGESETFSSTLEIG